MADAIRDEEINLQSIHFSSFLGWPGAARPGDDDPAEAYHEAAKLSGGSPMAPGAQLTEDNPLTEEVFSRPVKRHAQLPSVALPPPDYPEASIEAAVLGRRSERSFGTEPMSLQDLSVLLHAAYGVTGQRNRSLASRTVPSGGGLYPLDIYPVVRNVEGLTPGLYHYDPLRGVLEVLRRDDVDAALEEILLVPAGVPDFTRTASAVLFIVGAFWRTRFKYALRGYRFTLIEAGHVAQNVLLLAHALGVSAFPNGGYWDHKVDEFIGLDGVNESVLYSVVAGVPPAPTSQ